MATPDDMPSDRKFGLTIAAVLIVLGALPLISGRQPHIWLLAVAAVFGVLALAAPRLLSVANRLWYRFGLLLHAIINPVILGVLFFAAVTPVGLAMRAAGKRLLQRRFEPDSKSYWIHRNPPGPDAKSIHNQF